MQTVTLATAIVISEKSRSTWWRRIAVGAIERLPDDEKGRAVVSMAAVKEMVGGLLAAEDFEVLAQADAGDAVAQSDIGQLFCALGKPAIALHFLREAAAQGNADAMQWLGQMHARAEGLEKDNNSAVMWIAKAASHGHVIAQAQMAGLMPGP